MILRIVIATASLLAFTSSYVRAQDFDLVPCLAASDMDSDRLILAARLARQLGRDRAPVEAGGWPMMRIHGLPNYSPGSVEGPPEWLVSLYVPDNGDAVLELAVPHGSIRGANSECASVPNSEKPACRFQALDAEETVPVQFHVKKLPRSLAERLVGAIIGRVVGARIATGAIDTLRLHADTYQFSAWESGHGDRCAQLVLHSEEFENSPLGRLTGALREFAESEDREPETQEIGKCLEAVETE